MKDEFDYRKTEKATWGELKAARLEREKNVARAEAKIYALNEALNDLPSNSGARIPNAAQDGAANSHGRRGSLPSPPASLGGDEELVLRFDRRLLAAVVVLSWLAGFTTGMLLFWEPAAGGGAECAGAADRAV